MAEHARADQQPELDQERLKKQEQRLQRQVERLNEFLAGQQPKQGKDGNEIQSNAVDNESVKMPTSHGVIQGYNAQALVDSKHQVIFGGTGSQHPRPRQSRADADGRQKESHE